MTPTAPSIRIWQSQYPMIPTVLIKANPSKSSKCTKSACWLCHYPKIPMVLEVKQSKYNNANWGMQMYIQTSLTHHSKKRAVLVKHIIHGVRGVRIIVLGASDDH